MSSPFLRGIYDAIELAEDPVISTVTLNNVDYDIELPQEIADQLMAQLVNPDEEPLKHFRIKRNGSTGYKSIIETTAQCDTEANLRNRINRLANEKTSAKFPNGSHCKLSDDTTLLAHERPEKWSDVLNCDYSLVICCMHQKNSLLNYSLNDDNIKSLMEDLDAPYPSEFFSSKAKSKKATQSSTQSSSRRIVNDALAYAYKSDDVVTVGSYATNGHNDAEYSRRLWELLGCMNSILYYCYFC
jgi:hypothetical protein